MIRVSSRSLRLAAAGLTVALLGAACAGPNPDASSKGKVDETTTTTIAKGADTTAAQLRSRLTGLLQEHVYLAAMATGAIAGGRSDEVAAASKALDGNSKALADNMTAIFTGTEPKSDAETVKGFADLWNRHVGYVVAYAQGSSSAVNDLAQYAKDFGAFINSLLPSLPADAVTNLVTQHEQGLRAVVDAQKSKNDGQAYTALLAAAAHMTTVGAGLSGAIAKKLPDKIGGDPSSKAATLLTTLNAGLREHVFLASAATGAALGGRSGEFAGASAALDTNSDAIVGAIAGVYGDDAGRQFAPLWKKHIGFLVDYTTAVATKDQPKADKAMGDLLAYTEDFGAFISAASPKLTKDAVVDLIKTHVFTLKDVIDAQAAKDFAKADGAARTAADHMAMIATGLATTVVAQFPDKF
jgi:hypothetical protein